MDIVAFFVLLGKKTTQESVELDGYKHFMRQEVIWKTIEIRIITG